MGMAEPPIRPQIGGFGFSLWARGSAKFACLGRVLAGWVLLASNDIAQFALRLRQQSNDDETALRLVTMVGDVLADLELVHGVAPPSRAQQSPAHEHRLTFPRDR